MAVADWTRISFAQVVAQATLAAAEPGGDQDAVTRVQRRHYDNAVLTVRRLATDCPHDVLDECVVRLFSYTMANYAWTDAATGRGTNGWQQTGCAALVRPFQRRHARIARAGARATSTPTSEPEPEPVLPTTSPLWIGRSADQVATRAELTDNSETDRIDIPPTDSGNDEYVLIWRSNAAGGDPLRIEFAIGGDNQRGAFGVGMSLAVDGVPGVVIVSNQALVSDISAFNPVIVDDTQPEPEPPSTSQLWIGRSVDQVPTRDELTDSSETDRIDIPPTDSGNDEYVLIWRSNAAGGDPLRIEFAFGGGNQRGAWSAGMSFAVDLVPGVIVVSNQAIRSDVAIFNPLVVQ